MPEKLNKLLLYFFLLLCPGLYAGGVTQDIDRVCSFYFPGTPQVTQVPGLRNYLYQTDSCSYLVQIEPLAKKIPLHDTATLSSLYNGIVRGLIAGNKGSLIGKKAIDVKGLRGEEVEYVKGDHGHKPVSVCTRIQVVSAHVVVYTFTAPYSRYAGVKQEKERFFASFQLSNGKLTAAADSTQVIPAPATPISGQVPTPVMDSVAARLQPVAHPELVRSNTMRFIISFVLSILLLAGMLFAFIRWRKTKESNG